MGLIKYVDYNAYVKRGTNDYIPNPIGVEWNLRDLVSEALPKEINYKNYFQLDFDYYWDGLWNKIQALASSSIIKINLGSNSVNAKEIFKNTIINLYNAFTEEDKLLNPYYFYIKLEDIFKSIKNNHDLTSEEKENLINIRADDIHEDITTDASLRTPYISINKVQNFSNEGTDLPSLIDYLFKYHEIEFIKVELLNKITKFQLNAPLGTAFLINREPKLFYVTDWLNPNSPNNLYGKFIIDSEGWIDYIYITIPANSAPEVRVESGYITATEIENCKFELFIIYDDVII